MNSVTKHTHTFTVLLFLLQVISYFSSVDGISVWDDLILTESQNAALNKFRDLMKPIVDREYKKKDAYLIRWLRTSRFNVDQAHGMLIRDMKWREDNAIDAVLHDEDFNYFNLNFPYSFDSVDKDGKPLLFSELGEWDYRQAILTQGLDKMERFYIKLFEHAESRIREQQDKGQNVTRFQWIVSMQGFNLVQHSCFPCLTVYTRMAANLVNHYPGVADRVVLVNTPQIFQPILNLLRPLLGDEYRDIMHLLVGRRKDWIPKLREFIDDDQLYEEFGGLKIRDY